ncbi:MAG: hypothetical protein K6A70_04140 [Erysipelotrichaceae bacterium]|nr:hypothetical protein [Erysipelotrichaceae bacterium]
MDSRPSTHVVTEVLSIAAEHKLVTSMILVTAMGIAGAIIDNSYSIKLGDVTASPASDAENGLSREEIQAEGRGEDGNGVN